jgi:filamentous hemagglutinin family protein
VQKVFSPLLQIGLCTFGYLYATSEMSLAQVTTDGTVNTQVNQTDNVSEITGGETRGSNLFHSFQEFSVRPGNQAFFNNANNISNIFSRVTGGKISSIDGLIRANGSANLFLINPAGIIFGEGARLDIGGSFYGSSASSVLFEDGEFSAVDLENPPVLTVNAPIGLNFRDEPGDIINRSNFGLTTRILDKNFTIYNSVGLEVNPRQTLALIGGNVVLENIAGITAPGGRVELGGLSEAGTITINNDGSLTFSEGIEKGNISLIKNSQVNVKAGGGGFININANNLLLTEQSQLFAGIAEDSGSINSQAGDITINADKSVKLVSNNSNPNGLGTEINNDVGTPLKLRNAIDNPSNAIGNGGAIKINTGLLEISDEARIFANSYSHGNAGDIILNRFNY